VRSRCALISVPDDAAPNAHSARRSRTTNAWTFAILVALSVVALLLRAALVKHGDSDVHLTREWLTEIRKDGGIHALGMEIGNYTPVTLYLLLVGDWLLIGVPDIAVLKYAAIAGDLVGAGFAYAIVRLRYPHGQLPIIAFGVTLFTPTVVLNSAYWGQFDMVWTVPLVAALYFFLRGRSVIALVCVGVAFSFKQQAEFIFPFLLLLAIKRIFPWRYFLVVPGLYVLAMLPAFSEGRSAWNLLTIYVRQAGQFPDLAKNAPSLYQWLPQSQAGVITPVGSVVGAVTLLLLVGPSARRIDSFNLTLLVATATASVLVTPFVLPRMHDRYFFAADVLTIILAFYVPRLVVVAVLVQIASLASYWPFLFHHDLVPGPILAALNLGAIIMLLAWIASTVRRAPVEEPTRNGVGGARSVPNSKVR
jgi:Gpi18-like mannosyltransferase